VEKKKNKYFSHKKNGNGSTNFEPIKKRVLNNMSEIQSRQLVEGLSKGKGILSELAKDRIDSNTYTEEFADEIIRTVFEQAKDDLATAEFMWGEELVKNIRKTYKLS